ncbi:MAG: cysteine--tRNA ligase [Candidatus Aenigmarchaeota archaeon]|nr:cysteine--tRNA ligase [Candidatus Aenigmarchaeota archaeon]
MALKLFNTLTRKKETFKPLKDRQVKLYTCGPTVYDYAHIGNMRAYVWEDLLRRVLEFNKFKVTHVMNITDVGHLTSDQDTGEDKMEVGAKREHKSAWEIAEFYTKEFIKDIEKLHILKPHIAPKATDHIQEQIELIKILEKKGHTYIISDGVYFDTSKLKDYGKLARLNVEGLKAGARVEMAEGKRNPTDFALWKFSPKDQHRQMEWGSPWGTGFPGWHIECSAMSMKYLGTTFDIHTGGVDHIPVHHTNEIAQSEAATGKKFVNYWLHCNHLIVDGEKMSKSLGNFYRLKDITDRNYKPIHLRYFYTNSNYRSQLNFTFKGLDSAKKTVEGLFDFVRKLKDIQGNKDNPKVSALIKKFRKQFLVGIDDDLNFPKALASMFDFIRTANKLIAQNKISRKNAETIIKLMIEVDNILGLGFIDLIEEKREMPKEVLDLIRKRESARKLGDFATADDIRNEIRDRFNIVIEDTKDGLKWRFA